MPELAFVLGPAAPPSLADLVAALAAEVSRQDAAAIVVERFPEPRPDRVAVVIDELYGAERPPEVAETARSIAVVTVPPGSGRWDAATELARLAGSPFHVNSAAVASLHATGVPARHLQLGHSADWPGRDASPEGLAVLSGKGYLDWVGSLAAIHRGDVVLHERCLGMAPLVAGRDLFVAAPESLDLLAEILRGEPERLVGVRDQAAEFVASALPLALAAAALVGAARSVVAQPLAASGAQPAA